CAVLALHARGLKATPLDATPALVLPALVIPPVFYLLVAIVSMRPFSLTRVLGATGAMCGIHAVLVAATGALFMIPDLVDYAAALAFALWGAPAVTLLQLAAAPLVFARLRPLLLAPRGAPRADDGGSDGPRPLQQDRGTAPRRYVRPRSRRVECHAPSGGLAPRSQAPAPATSRRGARAGEVGRGRRSVSARRARPDARPDRESAPQRLADAASRRSGAANSGRAARALDTRRRRLRDRRVPA